MATTTTNYGLSKPAYADAADVAVLNSNMDIVDRELKSVSDTAAQNATNIAALQQSVDSLDISIGRLSSTVRQIDISKSVQYGANYYIARYDSDSPQTATNAINFRVINNQLQVLALIDGTWTVAKKLCDF